MENKEPEMITISRLEYDTLRLRDKWLTALEESGVDNWEGYTYAEYLNNVHN